MVIFMLRKAGIAATSSVVIANAWQHRCVCLCVAVVLCTFSYSTVTMTVSVVSPELMCVCPLLSLLA